MKCKIIYGKDLLTIPTIVIPVLADESKERKAEIEKITGIKLALLEKEEDFKAKATEQIIIRRLEKSSVRRVILVGLGNSSLLTSFLIKRRMHRAGRLVRAGGYSDVALIIPEFNQTERDAFIESALVGFFVGIKEVRNYKSLQEPKEVKKVSILSSNHEKSYLLRMVKRSETLSSCILKVKEMVDSPPNLLGPAQMADKIKHMVPPTVNVKIRKINDDKAFPMVFNVGRGSARKPIVVELTYRTKRKTASPLPHIALVGKGITFDSGGLNIKSFHNMLYMKDDMAGAASVAGIIACCARLGVEVNIDGIVPLAENTPSSQAYRPGDVIRARSGKTVEIISTDAEGRLILADALSYAVEKKPDIVIDIATLTGSCVVALGPFVGGLFSNDSTSAREFKLACELAGEPFWELPLVEEMKFFLRSDLADIRNTLFDPYGGAIGAALFLREFTGKHKWIHLDIAGPAFYEKNTEIGPRGATGFSVHSVVRFLEKLQ